MLTLKTAPIRRMLTAVALGVLALAAPASAEGISRLTIIAPANPGGGWDQTARVMQTVLQDESLVKRVQVQNVPGAGGTIGLAQFVTTESGKGDAILGAGQTLQGAVITNNPAVTLDQVTPLARTVGEFEIIVVPVDSPIQTLDDLVAALKANPAAVSWGGGSVGSTDHIVAGLVMKAVGADLTKLNYIAHSGGGEALTSIMGGHVTVGVSGYGEFGPQVESGKLRALALSSAERLPGVDIPTLKEQGIDVAFFNWRGLFAAPDVPVEDLAALEGAVDSMVKSQAWKDTIAERQWTDLYMPAAAFKTFLAEDHEVMKGILTDLGLAK